MDVMMVLPSASLLCRPLGGPSFLKLDCRREAYQVRRLGYGSVYYRGEEAELGYELF